VLPGPIDTEIWDQPDNEAALFEIEKVSAEACASEMADAIESEGFEYYTPSVFPGGVDAKQIAIDKVRDCDPYLRGMGEFAKAVRESR
jgi:hypothetical protein